MKKLFLSVFLGLLVLGAVAADAPAAPRCKACNGWGKVDKTEKTYTKNHNKKTVTTKVPCPECDGTGYDYAVKVTPADLAPYDLIGKPTAEVSTDKGTLYAPGKITQKYLRINERKYTITTEARNNKISTVVVTTDVSKWKKDETVATLKMWKGDLDKKLSPAPGDIIDKDKFSYSSFWFTWLSKDEKQHAQMELRRDILTIRYSVNSDKK